MTELLTLTPWPDGETLVEALGGAGGGIKEPSPTELGAGGAGGGTLEPSPTELGAGGAGGGTLEPSPTELGAGGAGGGILTELTAEKDCIRITSPRVEVGCEVTTEL